MFCFHQILEIVQRFKAYQKFYNIYYPYRYPCTDASSARTQLICIYLTVLLGTNFSSRTQTRKGNTTKIKRKRLQSTITQSLFFPISMKITKNSTILYLFFVAVVVLCEYKTSSQISAIYFSAFKKKIEGPALSREFFVTL